MSSQPAEVPQDAQQAQNAQSPQNPQKAQGRQRRARSASESLLSIVLGLEAVLVFFIALTLFGLDVLSPLVAFGGGAVLLVLLLLAGRMVSRPAGVWLGWVLQLVLILLGLLLPALYVAGAIFVAIWVYCFVVGRRLDRQKAEFLAANATP